ncbi:MAG: hypothetical protein COA49_02240 [Bacteroidetes bacterium]|nr:MAG: hypothetical protein COA49_02240 [Bacteroidota bacterium]
MKKLYLLSITLFLFSFSILSQENTVGTILYNSELSDGGYNLIYPHNQSTAFLMDMCGNVVHTWEHADTLRPANILYILENSDVITTYRPADHSGDAIWAGGGGASIERRTWNNDPIWSFTRNDSAYRLHHDIQPLANGNVLVTAWEQRDSLECIEAGRNPDNLTGSGIWSEVIWEIGPNDAGEGEVVWEWAVWDHLIQDFDSTKSNYGVVADNINKIDINFGLILGAAADWLHINAIDYDPFSQHIMVSVPTFNEIWIIDRGNMTPGEIKWRWGNPMAYDRGDSSDTKLGFQHHTHWLDLALNSGNPDFGKVGVFNNRVQGDTSEYSTVHTLTPFYDEYENEYAINASTGTYLPSDFDWTFSSPDPNTIYSNIVSSFQRLDNGNSLICSGKSGDTREYTQNGELVWYYKTPLLNQQGTASPVSQGTILNPFQNLTFRAQRYPADFPAFDGIDLIAGAPIELNPTPIASCFMCDLALELDSISYDSNNANISVSSNGSFDLNTIAWMNLSDSTILPFSQELDFSTSVSGDFLITVTDIMGCTASLVVSVIIDSVNTISPLAVGLYPNPTSGIINLVLNKTSGDAVVTIYDMQGQTVFTANNSNSSTSLVLDLSYLKNGAYTVVVQSSTGVATSRVIIKKL